MVQEISLVNPLTTESSNFSDHQIRVSSELIDEHWDNFLANTEGGHHVQTSLWAQVKASLGYRTMRVMVSQPDGAILSGAQILIRSFPLGVKVGLVPKGPVFAFYTPELEERTLQALLDAARKSHIQCLIVQPAGNGDSFVRVLTRHGFQPVNILLAPAATVLVDLNKDLKTILAEMKSRTRYNVRLGQKKGLNVRQGTKMDLPAFYELLKATSQRQQFAVYPIEYYEKLLDVFHPPGFTHLFMVERECELISALLAVTFGDTVINKLSVWSGEHGKDRPNEFLQWSVIEWSKANSYRYYDFEGVNPPEVRAILENEESSVTSLNNVTSYKLGFGGQVVFFPGAYLYITSPLLRPALNRIWPKIADSRTLRKIVSYIRTR